MLRNTRVTTALLIALAGTACSSGGAATPALPDPLPGHTIVPRPASPTPRPTPAPVRARPVAAALVSYGDCRRLVRGLRREATAEVTPYGLPQTYTDGGPSLAGGPVAMTTGSANAGTAAMAPAAAPAGPGYSTTNNQEAGVDEPDLVKTNGRLMVVVADQAAPELEVVDVSGNRPVVRGRLALPGAQNPQLFLLGDDAIVLAQTYRSNGSNAVATIVSLRDPQHPAVTRTFSADGQLVDARLLRNRVVLIVQSSPSLPFVTPTGPTAAAAATALGDNRRIIRKATVSDWLPAVTVTPGHRTYRTSCAKTMHPGIDSGIGTTSVITLDPAQSEPTQSTTVVGGGSVVYASTEALYLATTSWNVQRAIAGGRPQDTTTDLHGFDISAPDAVTYLGTGSVAGTLTDQYSLSEYGGYLRVATTVGELLPPPNEGQPPRQLSDNHVTVLKPVDGVLLEVGKVTGLGRGEKIYGVRFLGSLGYVVTFRQTDPLYVIDLADPTHPRTRGELKVTGFSSSLYPLDDGTLLGVGQGVDAHLRQIGTQVSVFDVRRAAAPTLRSRVQLRGAVSLAETDHHSLLWWPSSRLLVLPISNYSGGQFQGSIVYGIDRNGVLRERGRVKPPREQSACCEISVLRTVVVGDLLYSVTPGGLVTNRIDRLDHQAWLPFR